MTRMIRSCLLTGTLAMVAAATTTSAHASGDAYVCDATYQPTNGGMGNYGSIGVTWYSGANCTGNFVDYAYYCTTGAYSYQCDLNHLYSEAAINTLMGNLQRAAVADQKVWEQMGNSYG